MGLSLTVLLIEDNSYDVQRVKQALKKSAVALFNIEVASHLKSAEEALKKGGADAVIVDLNLPDSHGLDTFLALQDLSPHAPMVILSSLDDEALALEAMRKGAQDYLVKKNEGYERLAICLIHAVERKKFQENLRQQINYLEYYDPLTGMPSRVLFIDRLNQAIAQARGSNHLVAVLSLDLDNFKRVNDTLGHEAGNELLKMASRRITKDIPETDSVARIGGAGFTILLNLVEHTREAMGIADKIADSFRDPFYINQREIVVGISTGISLYPDDGEDAESLVKNADIAMHRSKDLPRNSCQLYSSSMNSHALERLGLENNLRHALEKNELSIHYQPQADLATGRITGAEALVRWNHPELGLISPTEFIPLAEETGLVVPINEWVLETAVSELRLWNREGFQGLRLSVNISSPQLEEGPLIQQLKDLLKKMGGHAENIQLELSEHVLMKKTRLISKTLRELKRMGARIAIDDFGTGYSSLSHLKRFPLDILKIDRLFVRKLTKKPGDAAIVTAIIAMAHSLNLEVIAEGVETQEQLEILKKYRCDKAQGYLISKPVAANEFIKLLKKSA